MKDKFMFINAHGSWHYECGHFVKRLFHGGVEKIFFRTKERQEYPNYWVKEQLTEQEKIKFVDQWNDTYKERCGMQAVIHPEDNDVLLPYKPLTFEEIIEILSTSFGR